MILKAVVGPELAGVQLDDGVKMLFPQFSKTRIRKVIDWDGCRISRSVVSVAARPLREGEEITLAVTDREPFSEWTVTAADVLHDDGEYLAVNKPAGIYCQRTPYQLKGTVEYAVGLHLKAQGVTDPPRVIHRLDRGTSGVMFFPKTRRVASHVARLLMEGKVGKVYWAMIPGVPREPGWTVDAPVASLGKSRFGVARVGREARTAFRVLSEGKGASLLEARPITGRTHQIRVHLAHCCVPVRKRQPDRRDGSRGRPVPGGVRPIRDLPGGKPITIRLIISGTSLSGTALLARLVNRAHRILRIDPQAR
jgi:RluA family pseudouridine synthase